MSRLDPGAAWDPAAVTDGGLDPGEMSLPHLGLIRAGPPNPGTRDHIGLVLRLVSPGARQVKAPDSAMLLRGSGRFGHFEPGREPSSAPGDGDIARPRHVFASRPSGFGAQIVA